MFDLDEVEELTEQERKEIDMMWKIKANESLIKITFVIALVAFIISAYFLILHISNIISFLTLT